MNDDPVALIEGCRRNDVASQRALYEACHEQVWRLAVRMLGAQEAPDVVQEVFLRVFRSLHQFSGASRFRTWLHRITINECLQLRRRSKNTLPLGGREPVDLSSDRTIVARMECELLRAALAELDPELRALLLLRETEGLTYDELARALAMPVGTIGSRLNRARTRLKEVLLRQGWEA
jgi:RNA polymerase sigma-70 factor, ECF subfamily